MDRSLLVIGVSSLALLASAAGLQQSQEEARNLADRLALVQSQSSGQSRNLDLRLADLESVLLDLSSEPRPEDLAGRIGVTEASLIELRSELAKREERLRRLDLLRERLELQDPDARIAELSAEIASERSELEELARGALELARSGVEQVAHLEFQLAREREQRSLHSDPQLLWRSLLAPVVQLAGSTSVGSGVLLESKPHPDGDGHRTLLVTAWHVVRDMQSDPTRTDAPIPVQIYLEDGGIRHEVAHTLCRDVYLDVCLAELDSRSAVPFGARLAPRERVASARVFEPVYAVGCPLGTDPVPSQGQISSPDHRVEGTRYWMINAPTYIGNSGGGIFDGDSFELLGVFSKIYNHGSSRPTIVPHMGLVMPFDPIYDWLATEGWISDGDGGLIQR